MRCRELDERMAALHCLFLLKHYAQKLSNESCTANSTDERHSNLVRQASPGRFLTAALPGGSCLPLLSASCPWRQGLARASILAACSCLAASPRICWTIRKRPEGAKPQS